MMDIADYDDRESRDATRARDAQTVGHFEVRYTDADVWVGRLKADIDHITDGVIYLAIITSLATVADVEGKRSFGGTRESPYFRTKRVEAAYLARGQIQKLSVYCGCVFVGDALPETNRLNVDLNTKRRIQSGATAATVTGELRKVEVTLSRYIREKHLDVIYGGALHLHNTAEPWVARPDEAIEAPRAIVCATCGEEIYESNGWRHKATGRTEAWKDAGKRHIDHVADPDEKGRTF